MKDLSKAQRKKKNMTLIIVLAITTLIFVGSFFAYRQYTHQQNDKIHLEKIQLEYKNLFKENEPNDNLTIAKVQAMKNETQKIKLYKNETQKLINDLSELESYLSLKEEALDCYNGTIMNSTVTTEDINKLKSKNKKLNSKYQKYIENYIIDLESQRLSIDTEEEKIKTLYTDDTKTVLKDNITINDIEAIRLSLNTLPQEDIKKEGNTFLDNALNIISEREAQAIEAEKKRQEEIKNAWVILNVPYISQNYNNVENGCEAASLLMALQYKGYLKNMTLYQYATDMPKSPNNNAQEGFTHDIFTKVPNNVPHWIAPEPLAKFGRTSSGNQNVVNITGSSLEDLDRELDKGNPVIIYLTSMFKTPGTWIEGAPLNLHVQLLTGYNKITKEHLIVDPWTYTTGRTKWIMPQQTVESIYNALGRQSIAIR